LTLCIRFDISNFFVFFHDIGLIVVYYCAAGWLLERSGNGWQVWCIRWKSSHRLWQCA